MGGRGCRCAVHHRLAPHQHHTGPFLPQVGQEITQGPQGSIHTAEQPVVYPLSVRVLFKSRAGP